MSDRKTTFILGAGASVPYGFPTGVELRNSILERVCQSSAKEFLEAGFDMDEVREFGHAFGGSGINSIDLFLAQSGNEHFSRIGKFAIAYQIAGCENHNSLFGVRDFKKGNFATDPKFKSVDQGWYRVFWNSIEHSLQSFADNSKFTFITFNYDRSLEHYLYNCFTNLNSKMNLSVKQIREHLSQIRIIHVHGSLGELPWEADSAGQSTLDYGDQRIEKILKSSQNIKIITESNDDAPTFQKARNVIWSNRQQDIYFLGFGFHRPNLSRLWMDNLERYNGRGKFRPPTLSDSWHKVYATTFKMGDNAVKAIQDYIGIKFENSANTDCKTFLENNFSNQGT